MPTPARSGDAASLLDLPCHNAYRERRAPVTTRSAEQLLAWAIAGSAELAAVANEELDAARAEPIAVGARDNAMLAHGVTGDARGAEIRRQAMASVIGPAARAVLAS